jgi:hypothetical protein
MKAMKRIVMLCSCLAGVGLLSAQESTTSRPVASDFNDYAIHSGSREVMISGGGSANKDVDNSFGALGVSYGVYFTDSAEIVFRQNANYSNPSNGDSAWNGSSKIALDYNLGVSRLRPFVGVNLGYVYGESVNETWAAGLEGGLKYYVRPSAFIAAMVDYGWFFDHADSIDNRFNDGQYTWSLGVGFNF